MNTTYDFVIHGTGFRSIFAALYLADKGSKVCIVDISEEIYSFLKPFKWKGYNLDKGPQYFDDFTKADWTLMEKLLNKNLFEDIDFSYASYSNGNLNHDFAIPVWNHFPELDTQAIFDDLKNTRRIHKDTFNNFDEYLKYDGGGLLYEHLKIFTKKFLTKNPEELSPLTKQIVSFCGRKVLFDNDLSIKLKKDTEVDNILAAKKQDVDVDKYNLYPISTNNEDIRMSMAESLTRLNIDTYLGVNIVKINKEKKTLTLSNNLSISFNKILLADNIQNSENYFYQTNRIEKNIYNLPEIFFIFEIEKDSFVGKNYVVNYDLNHISTRITNFSNYSNLGMDKDVICVEVPTKKDWDLWIHPESFTQKIKNELNSLNSEEIKFYDSKAFKINSTYKVPLKNYEKKVDNFYQLVKNDDIFIVPDHRYLTRKNGIDTILRLFQKV